MEPVGVDGEGAHYWNFNDERLYKEQPPEEVPDKHKYVLLLLEPRF